MSGLRCLKIQSLELESQGGRFTIEVWDRIPRGCDSQSQKFRLGYIKAGTLQNPNPKLLSGISGLRRFNIRSLELYISGCNAAKNEVWNWTLAATTLQNPKFRVLMTCLGRFVFEFQPLESEG